jgi:protocatechuate 3,4-dioxygenase beta subunit
VGGLKVALKNKFTGARRRTTTDVTGTHRFDPVDPGLYKITIEPLSVMSTTTVSGALTVKGGPSAGTSVKLRNPTSGATMSTQTDESGAFIFAGVDAGRYKLVIPEMTVP